MNKLKKHLATAGLLVILLGAAGLWLSAAPVAAQAGAGQKAPAGNDITAELLANGFSSPTALASTGINNDDRLFVVEKAGVIKIIADVDTGAVLPTPFLNITSLVDSSSERGLLGLAFSPDHASSGELYLYYTRSSDGDIVIARYTVSGDPNVVNAGSAEIVLTIPQNQNYHNGGHLAFGPDGYLYIGTGDDGGAGNAQDGSNLLGKMLRIDVVGETTYAIPANNPFVGVGGTADEIWALGLRNPWRWSFDANNGNLWIADVGDDSREEVNRQLASSIGSENYGWPCYEGTLSISGCAGTINHTPPVFEYPHTGGNGSITGGYVYRGSQYANMQGWYFYGDFNSGNYGMLSPGLNHTALGNLGIPGSPTSFGEDSADELYIATFGGSVYHLVGVSFTPTDFIYLPLISKP